MEANSTALCSKSNSQISLFVLVLVLAPALLLVHLAHLATVGTNPVLSHPPVPVHARLYTEGETDILPCEGYPVEDHMVGEVLLVEMFTDQAVHVAVLALDRLFAGVWTDFLQEGGLPAIPVVVMGVCAGRDQGATLCAPAVHARGPFRVLALAPVLAHCHIPRTRDIVEAGVVRGQSARDEEAIVATISGIAGPGHQRLCNFCFLSNYLSFRRKNADKHIINIKVSKTRVQCSSKTLSEYETSKLITGH